MSIQEDCERCVGSGYVVCAKCKGQGKVEMPPPSALEVELYYGTCDKCGGKGKTRCTTCEGTGLVTITGD